MSVTNSLQPSKVKPLGDRVLVRQHKEPEMTQGGIYLPETVQDTLQEGTVVQVGPGRKLDNGEYYLSSLLKAGVKVLFAKYAGTKVKVNGEELLVMREDDVMAVVEA